MQQELLKMEPDDRVQRMRNCMRYKLVNEHLWFPNAKELLAIRDDFKVGTYNPLVMFEEEAEKFVEHLIERCSDEDRIEGDAESGYIVKIKFYTNILKKGRKTI